MFVSNLGERVANLVKKFKDENLEINRIEIGEVEVVIDLDLHNFKKILKAVPPGSCRGIIEYGNKLILRSTWYLEGIGDVLFRTSL